METATLGGGGGCHSEEQVRHLPVEAGKVLRVQDVMGSPLEHVTMQMPSTSGPCSQLCRAFQQLTTTTQGKVSQRSALPTSIPTEVDPHHKRRVHRAQREASLDHMALVTREEHTAKIWAK